MKQKLVKSAARLAIEIVGKTRIEAENHLVRYGCNVSGAAAAVAMNIGCKARVITGKRSDIEYSISTNCNCM